MYSIKYKLLNFLSQMKIRHKILLLNIFILLLPIVGLALVGINYYQTVQIKKEMNELQRRLDDSYEQFLSTMQICNRTLQTVLLDGEIEDFIEKLMEDETLSIYEIIDFNRIHIKAVERLVNTNPYIHSIHFYLDKDILELAPVIYKSSRFKGNTVIEEEIKGDWHFGEIDAIGTRENSRTQQMLLATLTVPYLNMKKQQIGVVEVATPMQLMFPQMYELLSKEVMYLVDKEGTVYEEPNSFPEEWKVEGDILRGFLGEEEETKEVILGDEPIILGYKPIKNIGGYIVRVHSLKAFYNQMDFLRLYVTIGVLFLILIITLIINKSTHIIFKNFYKILEAIKGIQKGNLDVSLEDFGKGEIGELGRNIKTMSSNIKELMADKVNRETLVKDSEIRALQNQINAHFIYNVLESIKMMAEIEGLFDLSDAITALGKLLRYSMNWRSPKVKVQEEMSYIQNYVSLLNLRYDYKIILNIVVPEEILEQYIPKMCIQPIVENAIKHGIEEVAEDTTILIKGRSLSGYFLIEVTDSGVGMTLEEIEKLKMKIRGEYVEEKQSSNGIGLKNVQDRIILCFGEKYGLDVVSKKDCFTKIIIKIPYTK